MEKKPALGKGLSALIPDATAALEPPRTALEVDIDLLEANEYQPRTQYDDGRLTELAQSVAAHGIIQPIIVRRLPPGPGMARQRYQIIAGERRWRAAQRAGLLRVPVVIKDVADSDHRQQLEMALIENIQRENLNPIEEATAYQRLVDEFGLRQEDIASRVGKDRATVANTLRLLKLPDEVRGNVASGELAMGHARAILALASENDQRRFAREVIARGLSARETEALVKRETGRPKPASEHAVQKDVHTRAAEEQLRLALGTSVNIHRKRSGGTLEITFANEEELQRLYEYLTERK
ncbi:MAG: ParB/RepB/Spo0J family partition protein [Acidobacteria bacterium]|nr:ParB/RepB/Spo0J family partition protein [Acidobacteriota bacterium]